MTLGLDSPDAWPTGGRHLGLSTSRPRVLLFSSRLFQTACALCSPGYHIFGCFFLAFLTSLSVVSVWQGFLLHQAANSCNCSLHCPFHAGHHFSDMWMSGWRDRHRLKVFEAAILHLLNLLTKERVSSVEMPTPQLEAAASSQQLSSPLSVLGSCMIADCHLHGMQQPARPVLSRIWGLLMVARWLSEYRTLRSHRAELPVVSSPSPLADTTCISACAHEVLHFTACRSWAFFGLWEAARSRSVMVASYCTCL